VAATDPCYLTITESADLIRSKRLSPVELTRAYLARIEAINPTINAFISLFSEEALADAQAAEREIHAGHYRGPLHGVPIAVKDMLATRGHLTTCGSKILRDNVTRFDATAVARLKRGGCTLLGKTMLSEFGIGDDVNPLTGQRPTRNPWNFERSVSGSSSGSGAAVCASFCAGALGSDTGGSIRLPSAFCGIVGMKPTYGRVSRYGVTPLAWSLDNVGPMTKSVEDNALMLGLIAGADPADVMCSTKPVPDYRAALRTGVKGLRIGMPGDFFLQYSTRDVGEAVREAARVLERQGAVVMDVDLPHLKYSMAAELAIIYSESLAYHSKYLREGKYALYTETNQAQFDAARFISAADYVQAQQVRRYIIRDFEKAYEHVDVIIAPSSGIEANPIKEDEWTQSVPVRDVPAGTLSLWEIMWRMPCPANLSGVPALAVPCGFSAAGLPLGLQIMGRHWDEVTVYRVGAAYEAATSWHTRRPEISTKA
jgi:aspartyl-tRNA(Asn)/glutamyl-tRNA(Gln) amidotransferase subunit A